MQLTNMPMFDVILPIIEKNQIVDWTANEFWKRLKLTKKQRNRFNRQRMYRLLRKLVEHGFLIKVIHPSNPTQSKFTETNKINEFRDVSDFSTDFLKMKTSETKVKEEIEFLERQLNNYAILEKNFPNSKTQIIFQKSQCLEKITDLKAYKYALNAVLASL